MSDLPLCQMCGGTGEVNGIQGGPHGVSPWSKLCPAGCVATMVAYQGEVPDYALENLDPDKVILWCETHGGSSGNGKECDWIASIVGTVNAPCHLVVRVLGPIVGEPA